MPLVWLRVIFGALMLVSTARFILKGWVAEFYIEPQFHFTYFGFGWVKPLPPGGMYAIFGLLMLFSILISLGAAYRLSMSAFFLLFTYVELLDKVYYLNHYYFVSLFSFLLILLPLHRCWSVDAWLRPALRADFVPRWTVLVIQIQLGLVYFFAGLAKLNPDWLFHALPLAIWLPVNADFPLLGRFFDYHWMPFAMSWGGAFFDLTIPFWLMWWRSRPLAYLAVIGFHTLTGLLFRIGMFPWIMIGCTLIFFADPLPNPHTRGDFLSRLLPFSRHGERSETGIQPRLSAGLGILLAVFLLLQVLLPLRHWLYPGDVLWTEEGYRFSWRVMLVEKAGYTIFFLHDPATEREWTVYPNDILTPQQVQQMSFQPDMILSFAHYLAEAYREKGYPKIEVRVKAYVSWNGRTSHLLIDPQVDLARQPHSVWHRAWILPP